jgi:hypothetical protein
MTDDELRFFQEATVAYEKPTNKARRAYYRAEFRAEIEVVLAAMREESDAATMRMLKPDPSVCAEQQEVDRIRAKMAAAIWDKAWAMLGAALDELEGTKE